MKPAMILFHGAFQRNTGLPGYMNFRQLTKLDGPEYQDFEFFWPCPERFGLWAPIDVVHTTNQLMLWTKGRPVFLAGFSQGTYAAIHAARDLLLAKWSPLKGLILHSGFAPDEPMDLPILGIVGEREHLPAKYRMGLYALGLGLVDELASRHLHSEYNRMASEQSKFTHGWEEGDHRVPGLDHTWWVGGNRRMLDWCHEQLKQEAPHGSPSA